jgi:hypothetical protein
VSEKPSPRLIERDPDWPVIEAETEEEVARLLAEHQARIDAEEEPPTK